MQESCRTVLVFNGTKCKLTNEKCQKMLYEAYTAISEITPSDAAHVATRVHLERPFFQPRSGYWSKKLKETFTVDRSIHEQCHTK